MPMHGMMRPPCYCLLMDLKDQEECEACELIELHKTAVRFDCRMATLSKTKDKGVVVNSVMLWAKAQIQLYFRKVTESLCICEHWVSSDLDVYDTPGSENSDNGSSIGDHDEGIENSDNGSSIGDHDEGIENHDERTAQGLAWPMPQYPHV